MSKIAYLDNNATTIMTDETIAEMTRWANQGNPSAPYATAKKCCAMMEDFRGFMTTALGCRSHSVIFTSGATESNCMIIRAVIEKARKSGRAFHVVSSAIEHKSILLMLKDLVNCTPGMQLTLVNAEPSGHISPEAFASALRPETCLAVCMLANNETGAVNNIREIGRLVRNYCRDIFFHCDIVQAFGKIPINLGDAQVDGAAISFHKLHGPPGVGAAIIRQVALAGFCPSLYGTQNGGIRGGTENVIGIGAASLATRRAFANMHATEEHELALKKYLVAQLAAKAPVTTLDAYLGARTKMELQIVLLANADSMFNTARYLPGTLMVCATKHVGPAACNRLIRDKLGDSGVIVSVGSACNAANSEHSHVLVAMGVPTVVMDGAIRVSMCGFTTREEIDRFVRGFLAEVNRQYMTAKK